MRIDPFGVEIWTNAVETRCASNRAETCLDSLSIAELLALAGRTEPALSQVPPMRMTYGAAEGSLRRHTAIAARQAQRTPDTIVVAHGTIGADRLVHPAMVSAGDHVASILPTCQQHVSIPRSIGEELTEQRLGAEDGCLTDAEAIRRLVTPGTRLITLTNPNIRPAR